MSPFIGPLLFVGTIVIFLYISGSISPNGSIDNLSPKIVLDVSTKISPSGFEESHEVVSCTMDTSSSTASSVLEPVLSKVVEQSATLNEPVLSFIKKVEFEMIHFMHSLYQDDDPLFILSDVNMFFDEILTHYQNILTLINSKICLFGGSSIQNSTAGIDALVSSLNFKFQHLTLVFISYCQGMILYHQDNPLLVLKITNFINQFVNTDLLCIRILDPAAIIIDISVYLPVLHRAGTQEVLNSYATFLQSFGLLDQTVSHSVFECTILTLHSLNDFVLEFLKDLTTLSLEVSSVVPIML